MEEVNKVIYELPIERKCQRFAASLASFPAVASLIQDDKLTALDYVSTKTTRQGTQTTNTIYKRHNTLTIALDTLAQEWTEFQEEADVLRKQKIDYDELPKQIAEIRRLRAEKINEKSLS